MRHDFKRTDIWREGKWLDLWSVVHFLSGMSVAFGLTLFHFGSAASFIIALLLLVAYELWEALVKIEETPQNRFMDVVVGMVSFTPTFLYLVPALSGNAFFFVFAVILTINVVLSAFGWHASHKAALFEAKLRTEYEERRMRMLARRALKRKLRLHASEERRAQ